MLLSNERFVSVDKMTANARRTIFDNSQRCICRLVLKQVYKYFFSKNVGQGQKTAVTIANKDSYLSHDEVGQRWDKRDRNKAT